MQDKTIFYKQLLAHEAEKWENFVQGQLIAKALYQKGIPAVTALSYQLDHQAHATFSKIEGEVLSGAAASEYQAKQIGGWLARIHTANLHFLNLEPAVWHKHLAEPDWHSYIAKAKQTEQGVAMVWADVLEETLPRLKNWYAEYNTAQQLLDKAYVVASHGDLVQSNVVWSGNNSPHIIDWDSAGLVHPQVELLGVATNWSGVNTGAIDTKSFAAVLKGYQELGGKVAIDKAVFYAHLASWFNWLEYNIKQDLNGQNIKHEIVNTIKTMRFVIDLSDCLISYSENHS